MNDTRTCMNGSAFACIEMRWDLPSHGSGSVLAARSSIEKETSTPFSKRVSGSAFISQYCRSVEPEPVPVLVPVLSVVLVLSPREAAAPGVAFAFARPVLLVLPLGAAGFDASSWSGSLPSSPPLALVAGVVVLANLLLSGSALVGLALGLDLGLGDLAADGATDADADAEADVEVEVLWRVERRGGASNPSGWVDFLFGILDRCPLMCVCSEVQI